MAKRTNNPGVKALYRVRELCVVKNVDQTIRDGIDKAIKLLHARDEYCADVSSTPSAALQKVCTESMAHPFEEAYKAGKTKWYLDPIMITGRLNGSFLQVFTSASKAKRVLELGMFTGYGALALAEVLPPDGEVVTCEYDPYLGPIAQGLFDSSPHGKKIQMLIGDANDILKDLIKVGRPFDVIYIDADKEGYIGYYKTVMKNNLLSVGGTILFDNALMGGSPYMTGEDLTKVNEDGKAIKSCNEFLQSQTNITRVLLPLGDGVFMVRRKEDTLTK